MKKTRNTRGRLVNTWLNRVASGKSVKKVEGQLRKSTIKRSRRNR